VHVVVAVVLLLVAALGASAQTTPLTSAPGAIGDGTDVARGITGSPTDGAEEIDRLKGQLTSQQAQIDQLRAQLDVQTKLVERLLRVAAPAQVDSASTDIGVAADRDAGTQAADPGPGPLSWRIGSTDITPIGFVDLTSVVRNGNVGSSIATNFAAIPFSNTVNGQLRDYRFSSQNSRLGLRFDSKPHGLKLLGYLESDFQGLVPGNVSVTSNSDTQRLRLFWVDLRSDTLELLAGQSWSMLTPNRKGLSPLPADIFFTQVVDSSYHVGLTWSRNPQVRFVYHPNETVAVGVSVEASEQYGGGSGGSGAVTLPSELVSSYGPQLNTGGSSFATPNSHQDNIVKVALDPQVGARTLHMEVAGLLSRFAFYNPLSDQHHDATGGGLAGNLGVDVVKNLRLFVHSFYSHGGGRWIFGLGPNLIIRGDGSPSLVESSSALEGVEYQITPKALFYAYDGSARFEKNVAIDPANGQPIGFGYDGSPSNHNRTIREDTFGYTHTFFRDPAYGAIQLMLQYSHLSRAPWFVAPGQPADAGLHMLFVNFRYSLPGAPPPAAK
jgi:hypothetical protein